MVNESEVRPCAQPGIVEQAQTTITCVNALLSCGLVGGEGGGAHKMKVYNQQNL